MYTHFIYTVYYTDVQSTRYKMIFLRTSRLEEISKIKVQKSEKCSN